MSDDITYTFKLLTQYGQETVEDSIVLNDRLNSLAIEKQGFVRLEVYPPINGRRYLETIFDTRKNNFYTCVLEDRYAGQGFWEYRSKKVPKWRFSRLFKKHRFDRITMLSMNFKAIGLQRSVVAGGIQEKLYMMPFEVQSCVYDKQGIYGGDQTRPRKIAADSPEGKMLRQIIRKYYPDYQEVEIQAFLKKLDSEGCGYVVIVNTLFEYFADKVEAFEQTFGLSMYSGDGDFNYDMLLVDFYAATDNHYSYCGIDKINYEEDRSDNEKDEAYVYRMDTTGVGTNFDKRIYRTNLYLKKKGIRLKITNYKQVTLETVRELSRRGRIMISLKGGNVQNEDGSVYCYCSGHAMIVTGVSNDCRYIVSTWGMKKYVDPGEVVEKDGKKTEIYYQYFEIE